MATPNDSGKALGALQSTDLVVAPRRDMEAARSIRERKSTMSRVVDAGKFMGHATHRFGKSNATWMREVMRDTPEFRERLRSLDVQALGIELREVVAASELFQRELANMDEALSAGKPYLVGPFAQMMDAEQRRVDQEAQVIEHMPDGPLRDDAVRGKPGQAIRAIEAQALEEIAAGREYLGDDDADYIIDANFEVTGERVIGGFGDEDASFDAARREHVEMLIAQGKLLSMEKARREFNAEHGIEDAGRSFIDALGEGTLNEDDLARILDERTPDGYTASEYEYAQLTEQGSMRATFEGLNGQQISLGLEDFSIADAADDEFARLQERERARRLEDEAQRAAREAAQAGGAGGGGADGGDNDLAAGNDDGQERDTAALQRGEISPEEYMRRRGKAAMDFYNEAFRDNPYLRRDLAHPDKITKFVRKNQDQYAGMMVGAMLHPLSRGVDAQSLINVAMTATLMWAMSPKFRGVIKDTFDEINHELKNRRHSMMSKRRSAAFWGTNSQRNDAKKAAQELGKQFDRQMKLAQGKGGHFAMPAEVAASTLVQLSDKAYEAMRDGSTPVEYIQGMHRETTEKLLQQWEADGLDRGEVMTLMRDEIAARMAEDPAYAMRYSDTVSGQVVPTQRKKMRNAQGDIEWRWDGKMDLRGEGVLKTTSPPMMPRAPQTPDEHATNIGLSIICDIRRAGDDPAAVRDVLAGYVGGYAMRDVELRDVAAEGDDPDRKVACAGRVKACVAAMQADGIDAQQQEEIFHKAVGEALHYAEQDNPDLMAMFRHDHGSTWEADSNAWVREVQTRVALNDGMVNAPVWAGDDRGALEVNNYDNNLHKGERIGYGSKAPKDFVPKGVYAAIKDDNFTPPAQTLGEQIAAGLVEKFGVKKRSNADVPFDPDAVSWKQPNVAASAEDTAGVRKRDAQEHARVQSQGVDGVGVQERSARGTDTPHKALGATTQPGVHGNWGNDGPDADDGLASSGSGAPGPTTPPGTPPRFDDGGAGAAVQPGDSEVVASETVDSYADRVSDESDVKAKNDVLRRRTQERLRNQTIRRNRERLSRLNAEGMTAAQGAGQVPLGAPASAPAGEHEGKQTSAIDESRKRLDEVLAQREAQRTGRMPKTGRGFDRVAEHESPEARKARVDAQRAREDAAPHVQQGVAMSQAEQTRVEAHNNDYSVREDERVEVNYDDPSTPSVDESKGMSSSLGRSRKHFRSMANMVYNDEEYWQQVEPEDNQVADRVMQVQQETQRTREEMERMQREMGKHYTDDV